MSIVGVISDTHGLLRPQALAALRGADLIVHAGDVGDSRVIESLRTVAPVFAVRGNVDRAMWAWDLPETEVVEAGALRLYVLHDLSSLELDLAAAGIGVVIFGHSHRPAVSSDSGILYLNPGSAGPRRFRLPVSVARLTIDDGRPAAEIIELDVP